eukprot:6344379-Alexandrium_andersonii.AAC.1
MVQGGSCSIHGFYGTTLVVSKNIPKHQREAGQLLRCLIVAIEQAYGKVKYSDIVWELDALEVEGEIAAAISDTPDRERIRTLHLNEAHFQVSRVAKEMAKVWKVWNGHHEKWEKTSTAASSPAASSSSWASARAYYVQDHWSYVVVAMTPQKKEE